MTREYKKRTPRKKALITGITGQDGSYLAEFLLSKGYEVCGIVRKTSHLLYANIAHIQHRLNLHNADLLDPVSIIDVIKNIKPDELYNLASQSVPATSFKQPIHTIEVTGSGHTEYLTRLRKFLLLQKFIRLPLAKCLVG